MIEVWTKCKECGIFLFDAYIEDDVEPMCSFCVAVEDGKHEKF